MSSISSSSVPSYTHQPSGIYAHFKPTNNASTRSISSTQIRQPQSTSGEDINHILKFFPWFSMVAALTHSVTKKVVTQPQTSSGKFSNDQYICNFFNSLEWWLFQHIQLLEKAMSKENKPSKLVNNKIIIQFLNINDKYLS